MSLVTIVTDFGIEDPYVAMMKGRMLEIEPDIDIVDVTHHIEPGNIHQAAFIVGKAFNYFPPGSVHLVVVDPTVGSSRRAIINEYGDHYFVGPDNGVFSMVLSKVYKITKEFYGEARTFEGRDLFAPAAALLAGGNSPELLGKEIDDPVSIDLPEPEIGKDGIRGEIIYIDKFGNLITNIKGDDIPWDSIVLELEGMKIEGLYDYYSEVNEKDILLLINGGFNLLEIAINRGNAAELMGCKIGSSIEIRRKHE